jgi:hypothetical protein
MTSPQSARRKRLDGPSLERAPRPAANTLTAGLSPSPPTINPSSLQAANQTMYHDLDFIAAARQANRAQQAAIDAAGDVLAAALAGGRDADYLRRACRRALELLRCLE